MGVPDIHEKSILGAGHGPYRCGSRLIRWSASRHKDRITRRRSERTPCSMIYKLTGKSRGKAEFLQLFMVFMQISRFIHGCIRFKMKIFHVEPANYTVSILRRAGQGAPCPGVFRRPMRSCLPFSIHMMDMHSFTISPAATPSLLPGHILLFDRPAGNMDHFDAALPGLALFPSAAAPPCYRSTGWRLMLLRGS